MGLGAIIFGITLIWISTLKLPDLESFDARKVANSTKIYDRTGEVVLYDLHDEVKRTVIPFDSMGIYIKNATVAIEDSEFYQHHGIRVKAIMRAVFTNLLNGDLLGGQGGSTITQQVVKNTLLTSDRTITRKIKEWVLALKMETIMSKEEILALYLNDIPYGGNHYGIEEASKNFFGIDPADLSLAQASYLAAIPKAPTFFSPYGTNRDKLEDRKNTVLFRMKELGFITEEEYTAALAEVVTFLPSEAGGIKAPHFVFFIKQYLEEKYGADMVESGGLKVITTLDYKLQERAEKIIFDYMKGDKKGTMTDENAGLLAMDPKTGQILVMVGSRDYFDEEIDGNFNVTLAQRQPGSSFKPFVYSTAFKKGYTPETVLFDVPTEFSTLCDSYGFPNPGVSADACYMPQNYDGLYHGPMTIREALGRSMNVPAVETLYLAGIDDSIKTAKDMGITTLVDRSRYGLSLVLGGGEVRLVEMVGAYGSFATGGTRHPYTGILSISTSDGKELEAFTDSSLSVLPENVALQISDILSDNEARTPTFGANSKLYFPGRQVAVKTGTTNDFKDSWIIGYTPSFVAGAWVGKNDNTAMKKGVSSAPFWHDFMEATLAELPSENFEKPTLDDPETLKPVLRGIWQGGANFTIDSISGKLATDLTPIETRVDKVSPNVHSILHWVDKNDPRGPIPENPANDPAYIHWETAVQNWWSKNQSQYGAMVGVQPDEYDDIHTKDNQPIPEIDGINEKNSYDADETITLQISGESNYPLKKADIFLNNKFLGSTQAPGLTFSFTPSDTSELGSTNDIRVILYDSVYNSGQETVTLKIK